MTLAAPIEYTDAAQMLADYAERRKRMFAKPVARVVPKPEPAEEPVAPVVGPLDIPDFLGLRPKCRDWMEVATKARVRPSDSTIIIELVSRQFDVPKLDLLSERRTAAIVRPRMVACWLMRTCTTMSMPSIGRRMGGRDHTTVLNACNRVNLWREADPEFRDLTDKLARVSMLRIEAKGE